MTTIETGTITTVEFNKKFPALDFVFDYYSNCQFVFSTQNKEVCGMIWDTCVHVVAGEAYDVSDMDYLILNGQWFLVDFMEEKIEGK